MAKSNQLFVISFNNIIIALREPMCLQLIKGQANN